MLSVICYYVTKTVSTYCFLTAIFLPYTVRCIAYWVPPELRNIDGRFVRYEVSSCLSTVQEMGFHLYDFNSMYQFCTTTVLSYLADNYAQQDLFGVGVNQNQYILLFQYQLISLING